MLGPNSSKMKADILQMVGISSQFKISNSETQATVTPKSHSHQRSQLEEQPLSVIIPVVHC